MPVAPATVHRMPDSFRRWPMTDLQPASDDAGAGEQAQRPVPGVAHAVGVGVEVVQGLVALARQRPAEFQAVAGGEQGADVAGVEFGEPLVAVAGQQPGGQVRQLMHVLAGVKQVDDLGCLGEMRGGEVPDPRRAVAQDGELADVVGDGLDDEAGVAVIDAGRVS